MRRPFSFFHAFLALCATLVIGYVLLAWSLPRYLHYRIRRALDFTAEIGDVQLEFPFTVVLTDVRSMRGWPTTGWYAERIVIRPAAVSWARHLLHLTALEIERPWIRVTRTDDGEVLWPRVDPRAASAQDDEAAPVWRRTWQLVAETADIRNGTLEIIDQQPAKPFHGVVDHLSLMAGPITLPLTLPAALGRMTFAVSAKITGQNGHGAPAYCSGWLDPEARDLEASCRLEPLRLAAFDPYYYEGRLQLRVYESKLEATTRWAARDNALDGRTQLKITDLSEGDLSLRGRTLADVKQLAGGEPPILTGEIKTSGPLDQPQQWSIELVPGNEIVQRLMKPLLVRGIELVPVKIAGQTIKVGIMPATKEIMTEIEETGKEVEKSLEMLTPPLAEEPVEAIAEEEVEAEEHTPPDAVPEHSEEPAPTPEPTVLPDTASVSETPTPQAPPAQ